MHRHSLPRIYTHIPTRLFRFLPLCSVEVPSDLAIAFVLSRPLRRVRLPLELAAAEALSRAFPALTRVHVMAMFRAIPGYRDPEHMAKGVCGQS